MIGGAIVLCAVVALTLSSARRRSGAVRAAQAAE